MTPTPTRPRNQRHLLPAVAALIIALALLASCREMKNRRSPLQTPTPTISPEASPPVAPAPASENQTAMPPSESAPSFGPADPREPLPSIAPTPIPSGPATPPPERQTPPVPMPSAQRWSDPKSWGGKVPARGSGVVIAKDQVLTLDQDVQIDSLRIEGTLLCDPARDVTLEARWILVYGRLACGRRDAPHTRRFEIVLTGEPSNENVDGFGTKVLGVASSGQLILVGEQRTSWTRLTESLKAGAKELKVESAGDWRPGDQVVVASTDFAWEQAEERTISQVAGDRLTLDAPLRYPHFGRRQTYPNPNKAGLTELDERAEVGLLSRNIVIRGDDASAKTGFGAHVMAMGALYLSGVEMRQVGQRGRLARYPVHWHLGGASMGQYLEGSSIHHSYNRCVTLHGVHQVQVVNNVCYDHVGHGFFLEDGVERGNVLEGNLGLSTRAPKPDEALLPSDSGAPFSMGRYFGPATFWLANPDNIVKGNVAAGSDGSGFWYAPKRRPTGPSAMTQVEPYKLPPRLFDQNVAHSSQIGLVVGFDQDDAWDWYLPQGPCTFSRFLGYKITGDTGGQAGVVWVRGGHGCQFKSFVTADARHHYNFSYDSVLDKGLLVGESQNLGHPQQKAELALGRTLPVRGNPGYPITGFGLYDGPHGLRNVHFAGFGTSPGPKRAAFEQVDGAYSSHNHWAEGVTFAPGTVRFTFPKDPWALAQGNNVALIDRDGSLTGRAGVHVVGQNQLMRQDDCPKVEGTPNPVYVCDHRYGHLLVDLPTGASSALGVATMTREDGAAARHEGHCRSCGAVTRYQFNVITGKRYRLAFEQPDKAPGQLKVEFGRAAQGDWITLELAYPKRMAYLYRGGLKDQHRLPVLGSVEQVKAAPGTYAATEHGLFLHLATGQGTSDAVIICEKPRCTRG